MDHTQYNIIIMTKPHRIIFWLRIKSWVSRLAVIVGVWQSNGRIITMMKSKISIFGLHLSFSRGMFATIPETTLTRITYIGCMFHMRTVIIVYLTEKQKTDREKLSRNCNAIIRNINNRWLSPARLETSKVNTRIFQEWRRIIANDNI